MGWDDGDAFGADAFGDTTADCFGQLIEDADPFSQGNDSFGGDKEWTTFNDEDSGGEGDVGGHHHDSIKHSSSRSSRDESRHIKKTSDTHGTKSRIGHRIPSSNGQERPSPGGRSSPRKMGSRGDRKSCRSSPSPATSSSGRRKAHSREPNSFALDNFVTENTDVKPFRIGIESSSGSSPSNTRCAIGNSGFADFDASFDSPSLMTLSPTRTHGSPSITRTPGKAKVIHDRHGRVQRLTATEERNRSRHSDSRRKVVKDSIFSSLRNFEDEKDSDLNKGLSTYLSEKSGRNNGRRRRCSSSNDSAGGNSTQSAPAANHGHYQQRHHGRGPTKQSSHDDGYALHQSASSSPRKSPQPSSSGGRSLRSRLPPSGVQRRARGAFESTRNSTSAAQGQNQQQILSLDVQALAEHGRLEVVDGKMRLVLDIDTIAR
jgi:hypothetical protein